MPVCTRSASAASKPKLCSVIVSRRSARIARANWLKRLRPRPVATNKTPTKPRSPGKQRRAHLYAEQQPAEVFIMTKNPMFEFVVKTAEPRPATPRPATPRPATPGPSDLTSWLFGPPVTAPRECTGWNCVCAAPNGYGEGRTNYCRFYDTGAAPGQDGIVRSTLPMLQATLLPLMLATIGIPVIPSSPRGPQ